VFLGGGTPSLMEPETVAAILGAIGRAWHLGPNVEITLEANPTSVEAGRFRGYRSAGVNRLSVGVQALEDRDLRRLGRLHSAAEARSALSLARSMFPRVSADLIYARQDQSVADWQCELEVALDLGLDHLSLYPLTIEDGTVFGERSRRGLLRGLPDEELAADLHEATQALCEAAGLPAYEVSNHARPGDESRHNLVYWRAGDWVGIGPGAMGRISLGSERWGSHNAAAPAGWLEAVGRRAGAATWEPVGEHGMEYLMMGLRLREGVSLDRMRCLGMEVDPGKISDLTDGGFVAIDGDRLCLTAKGRPVLDAVLRTLV
jgi:oxygen-independent coproporphyrinogen-3 oxidase